MRPNLPFPDNHYWRMALIRAITAAWDNSGDAISSLKRIYDPDDNFYFETHEHRYFIKVRALTPDFIKDVFAIHDQAVTDMEERRDVLLQQTQR